MSDSVDLHNDTTPAVALNIQAISTDTTTAGVIIDTQGFASIEFVMQSGTLTDGAYLPLIQDGDDSGLSDAAAVDDTFLTNTEASAAFALADDNAVKSIGYVGHKRYVRLSIVSSATSSGGTLGAVCIKGAQMRKP
jgi:hypothetical protein